MMIYNKTYLLALLVTFSFISGLSGQVADIDDAMQYAGGTCCTHSHFNSTASELGDLNINHNYDVRKYTLHIVPDLVAGDIWAKVFIELQRNSSDEDEFEFHFGGEWDIKSVTVNGIQAEYSHDGSLLFVQASNLSKNTLDLRIGVTYRGIPTGDENHGRPAMTIESDHVWTMSQPFNARYWFPCYDLPSDKAEEGVEQFITVPEGLTVAANGRLQKVTDHGNTKEYHWKHDYPISSYLIAFAAAPYTHITDSVNDMPLDYFILPDQSVSQAEYDLGRQPEMIKLFSELFGEYPFEAYGVMFVRSTGWAMEHQSMTTAGQTLVYGDRRAETVFAHEIAHQWWGDAVTLKDYSDIWLNEGFASYCEILWIEHTEGSSSRNYYIRYFHQRIKDDLEQNGPHSLYRNNEDLNLMFSSTIYKKGALVLHALRYEIGDEDFFAGMRRYLEQFRYSTAEIKDFRQVMESVSGRSLEGFFKGWIYGTGWPVLAINSYSLNHAGKRYRVVTVTQTQEDETVFVTSVPLDLDGNGPLPMQKTQLTDRYTQFVFEETNQTGEAEIGRTLWVMYDRDEVSFESPEVTGQTRDELKAGKSTLFRIRANNINAGTRFYFDTSKVELISAELEGNNSIKVLVKIPADYDRDILGYKLINPDGNRSIVSDGFRIIH